MVQFTTETFSLVFCGRFASEQWILLGMNYFSLDINRNPRTVSRSDQGDRVGMEIRAISTSGRGLEQKLKHD